VIPAPPPSPYQRAIESGAADLAAAEAEIARLLAVREERGWSTAAESLLLVHHRDTARHLRHVLALARVDHDQF
jgi:hypothetical protein